MQLTKLSVGSIVFSLILSVGLLAAITPAQALDTEPSGWLNAVKNNGLNQVGETAYNTYDEPLDIRTIVANLVNVFLGLLGTIFVVLMVAGGIIWMTAAGNPEKVKKAINLMAAGAIGLLIVLAAFAITLFITSRTLYSVEENNVHNIPDSDIKYNE